MIFRIDHTTLCTWDEQKRTRLIWNMLLHHHLIDCLSVDVHNDIQSCLEGDDARRMSKRSFEITDQQRDFLTSIDVRDYTYEQLLSLTGEKSRLLIENGPYEWNIHKQIALAYKKDPKFGNVFEWVHKAIENHDLYCLHGGGCSTYNALIEMEEGENYPKGVFSKKHVIVFDRDTDSAGKYSQNQNTLLNRLCGKMSGTVTEADVYTFDSNPNHPYIWHVWYKRAIENYFTDEQYEKLGVDTKSLPRNKDERDYCDMEKLLKNCGYKKSLMAKISRRMTWKDFESNIHKFDININGETLEVSELQLLLLKIVKIL